MKENSIRIEGSCSIDTVADQMSALLAQLKYLRDHGESPRVDLSRLEEIDPSGWQLLAFWFRHVRRLGLNPVLVNVRQELRDHMERLGFALEFGETAGERG